MGFNSGFKGLINVQRKPKNHMRIATVLLFYIAQKSFKDLKRRGMSVNAESCSVNFE